MNLPDGEPTSSTWRAARASVTIALATLGLGWWVLARVDAYPAAARRAPAVMTVALIVVAAIVVLRDTRTIIAAGKSGEARPRAILNFFDGDFRSLGVTVMFAAYVLVQPRIGFIWSTVPIVLAVSIFLGLRRPWYAPLLLAVVFTAIAYLSFVHAFALRLP